MFTAVGLQVAATIALGLVTWLSVDLPGALSLVLGGAAAFIPNGLFALRLAIQRGKAPESYPVVFFLGEFAKIGLTVAILVAVVKGYDELRWLALLIGLIVALKVPLFALWLTGNRRPIAQLLPIESAQMAAERKTN